jgi:WD40 repeat protein
MVQKQKPLLQFWNRKGNLIKSVDISKGEYRNITWNPKGDRLATASDALRIWDKNGKLLHEGSSKDYLWGISWNRNGSRIVTSSIEQRVIIWDSQARVVIAEQK